LRKLFDRDTVLASDWYNQRLRVKQERDTALWHRHVGALEKFQQAGTAASAACDFNVEERLREARTQLSRITSPTYLRELRGTIGADPFVGQINR